MPTPFWDSGYSDLEASTMGGPSHEVIVLGEALQVAGFSPRRVIDLGSGEGRNSLFLAGLGHQVTAVDISERAVAKLRYLSINNHLGIKVEMAKIETLQLSGMYDLVLAHGSLHFVSRKKLLPLICRLQTSTSEGGAHVITLSLFDDGSVIPEFKKSGHRNPLAREELLSLYTGWETVLFESYRKWDTHPGIGEHNHPIEKWIFLKPGGTRIPILSTPVLEDQDNRSGAALNANFSKVEIGSLASDAEEHLGLPDSTYVYEASGTQLSRDSVSSHGYKLILNRYKRFLLYCVDGIVVGKAEHYRKFCELGVLPTTSLNA
jgi:tellurite methyltransferase